MTDLLYFSLHETKVPTTASYHRRLMNIPENSSYKDHLTITLEDHLLNIKGFHLGLLPSSFLTKRGRLRQCISEGHSIETPWCPNWWVLWKKLEWRWIVDTVQLFRRALRSHAQVALQYERVRIWFEMFLGISVERDLHLCWGGAPLMLSGKLTI